MQDSFATTMVGLLALLVFSPVALAQTGGGAQNTLYNRLNRDPSTGGARSPPRSEWFLGGALDG
jgi:hypothetical protein